MGVRARVVGMVVLSVVISTVAAVVPQTRAAASEVLASQLPGLLLQRADDSSHLYNRDEFQLWVDADGNGCNTRSEVLIEESTIPVTYGSGCTVSTGNWVSPYDNVTWTAASDVDIDHVVPLADAWKSGAWSWTANQRMLYANDLGVAYALIAVTDNVNQAKGDQDPAHWMPPYAPFQCDYVIDWALVKYRWSLSADPAEYAKLTSMLTGSCGSRTVTLPTVMIDSSGGGTPSGFPPGVTRLYGSSRYETAIAVSQRYAPGVPAVFVATGTDFPDALSGAAAAALLGGPLLLTTPTSLPASVDTELRRLTPQKIYVLGSPAAVSTTVSDALARIAPVQRFGGSTRYDTGLKVVDGIFASSSTAFIATGRDFPDALAASGAAGKLKAPVVLVDGMATSVPAGVMNSLHRMGVTKIVIGGSAAVVSNGIATQLTNAGYSVSRYGGKNRYETTALINDAFFAPGTSETAFLATGSNFPDALSGGALAGLLAAPMYITTTTCAPAAIYNSVNTLNPSSTVVLGSTAVVDDHAAMNWQCPPGQLYPGTVTPGAYCAQQYSGWYGYTSTGSLMRCMTSNTDSRLRWRQA